MISTPIDDYPLQDRGQDWPPLPEMAQRPLHQAVLAALGPVDGQRLLHVGCGVGLFMRAAERRGALVAGTDTAVERLEIARWALPDADLRVGDPEALPFDNGTFDVVTATGGAAVLTELARVARPGGLVAVGSWVRPSGSWAETFVGHLRRLALLAPEDAAPWAPGLSVCGSGEVPLATKYPSPGAAWTTMLGCEDILRAVRLVGESPVRAAFVESVAHAVAADGTLRLPKTFRYVVARAC
jgi:SAM-dependent methyltransferase